MKKNPVGIGAAIQRFRELRGLTQDEFAAQISPLMGQTEISRGVVSQWEKESAYPSDRKLRILEQYMDLDEGSLILAKFARTLRRQGIGLPKFHIDAEERNLLNQYRAGDYEAIILSMIALIRSQSQAKTPARNPRKSRNGQANS
ncbi:MAG: helix-turn-helix transcriptional regulator [Bryobacteraceae bacterium]